MPSSDTYEKKEDLRGYIGLRVSKRLDDLLTLVAIKLRRPRSMVAREAIEYSLNKYVRKYGLQKTSSRSKTR
jgi:predicted DNA-binding protein